jgi:hypothetical protein
MMTTNELDRAVKAFAEKVAKELRKLACESYNKTYDDLLPGSTRNLHWYEGLAYNNAAELVEKTSGIKPVPEKTK